MAFKDQKKQLTLNPALCRLGCCTQSSMNELLGYNICQLMVYEYTACMSSIPCHVINEFVLLEA